MDELASSQGPAGGTGGEVAAEAEPDERDAVRVGPRLGDHPVEHLADHVLPVGPQDESLLEQRRTLARPVEAEHPVAVLEGGGAGEGVELLGGAVVAAGEHDDGTGRGGAGGFEPVPRQRGVVVGELDDLGRLGEEGDGASEGVGLVAVRGDESAVRGGAVEHHPGGSERRRGPEERRPGRIGVARKTSPPPYTEAEEA